MIELEEENKKWPLKREQFESEHLARAQRDSEPALASNL